MKPKLTVSIGIPVFNEKQNIGYLIESFYSQKQISWKLKHVIIVCDGSTDESPRIIQHMKDKFGNIIQVCHTKQKGKSQRLNEIYKLNTADYLLTFDADVHLMTNDVIEKLVTQAKKTNALLTAAQHVAMPHTKGVISKIFEVNFHMWSEVRSNINYGDTIYNVFGSAQLLSKSITSSLRYPRHLTCDQGYLYAWTKRRGTVAFAPDAKIGIYVPANFTDFLLSWQRSEHERNDVIPSFPEADSYYHIPQRMKWLSLKKAISKYGLYALIVVGLNILMYLPVFHKKQGMQKGFWKRIESTKQAFTYQV